MTMVREKVYAMEQTHLNLKAKSVLPLPPQSGATADTMVRQI